MSSSNSIDVSSIEFNEEDTYEHLKDIKKERETEIFALTKLIQNNQFHNIRPDVTPEEIRYKRALFAFSLSKFVRQEQPRDFPIIKTPDFYADILNELSDEIKTITELDEAADEEIKELEIDIASLKDKISTLKELRESFLPNEESEMNTTKEMKVVKKIFHGTKIDLENVIEKVYPDNENFQMLLALLTRALSKGGDDLYVDVEPNHIEFINFLEEADIIQFHPHDNNKIRLMDM